MSKRAHKTTRVKTPEGLPPVKKMIDLTKDKTDPKASKFNTAVEKSFIQSLKKLNIPVCEMMATNPHMLAGYMISRQRYLQFMGDCGQLVDQCLRDAIVKAVLSQMVVPELNKVTYPGKWDEFNLFALARSRVNIIIPIDKPELGAYLTCAMIDPNSVGFTTEQMTEEGSALSFMRMLDYNPNRLYQFGILVASVVVKIISTSVESDLPLAYLTTAEERLTVRYGRELTEVCRPAIQDWAHNTWSNNAMTFKSKMDKLAGDLYSPVANYIAALTFQSGIDEDLIEKVLSPDVTELKITLILDQKEDITETDSVVQYRFLNKDKTIKWFGRSEAYNGEARLAFNMGLLYRLAQMESPKKSELAAVGKQVRAFLDTMVAHTFNMYLGGALFINTEEDEKTPDTSDPAPEFTMQDNGDGTDGADAGSEEE